MNLARQNLNYDKKEIKNLPSIPAQLLASYYKNLAYYVMHKCP